MTYDSGPHHTASIPQKKHHHGLPNPPAPGSSNFTGECNRRMSRNRSRSLQSGDGTFIDQTNKFFILLTNILFAAAQRARDKR